MLCLSGVKSGYRRFAEMRKDFDTSTLEYSRVDAVANGWPFVAMDCEWYNPATWSGPAMAGRRMWSRAVSRWNPWIVPCIRPRFAPYLSADLAGLIADTLIFGVLWFVLLFAPPAIRSHFHRRGRTAAPNVSTTSAVFLQSPPAPNAANRDELATSDFISAVHGHDRSLVPPPLRRRGFHLLQSLRRIARTLHCFRTCLRRLRGPDLCLDRPLHRCRGDSPFTSIASSLFPVRYGSG